MEITNTVGYVVQISMAAQRRQTKFTEEAVMKVNEGTGFCQIDKEGGGCR